MSRALSLDLRMRVLAAVAAGASHRAAADRFGVSAASVSRWRALERAQGNARPKALGGDRRSGRIEAHAERILSRLKETPDITIDELRRALGADGLEFGFGTIQRFFKRHRITRKKDRARQRTESPGRPEETAGLVRRSDRSRPRAVGLHRYIHTSRMHQLLRRRRIRSRLMGFRSRCATSSGCPPPIRVC